MALVTLRGYAKSRKNRGLPGGSPAGVKKAIDSRRIVRLEDGRIDESAADEAWRRNTIERCPVDGVPHPVAKVGADHSGIESPDTKEGPRWNAAQWAAFRGGVGWISNMVCRAAGAAWPPIVQESWGEMPPADQRELTELVCGSLESWLAADRVAALPAAAHTGIEFLAGARVQAQTICAASRQRFPALIAHDIFADEEKHSAVHLIALVLSLVENWLEGYIHPEKLPPIDWDSVFPDSAESASEEYRTLRSQWAG